MQPSASTPRWAWPLGIAVGIGLALLLPGRVASLRATHGAVATYTALLAAANAQDVAGVRSLCTRSYVDTHPIRPAREGGIVGLPRNIHKNFQCWRENDHVLLCPTNRVGPVYRFEREDAVWKFAGPIGLLGPHGELNRSEEFTGEVDSP